MDGAAEKVTPPLFTDKVQVDLTGSQVGCAGEVGVDKPFVVAQVEVGFPTVGGDKYFPVLVGGHGARIDIQVGVELDYRNR